MEARQPCVAKELPRACDANTRTNSRKEKRLQNIHALTSKAPTSVIQIIECLVLKKCLLSCALAFAIQPVCYKQKHASNIAVELQGKPTNRATPGAHIKQTKTEWARCGVWRARVLIGRQRASAPTDKALCFSAPQLSSWPVRCLAAWHCLRAKRGFMLKTQF
jgi:hypothetical protein